jgi:hypothetical protein
LLILFFSDIITNLGDDLMDILQHDLNKAISLLEYYPYNKQFDYLYPFCNENIKELFSYFNLKDKDCLTVLGGSDQAFDMFLKGAKTVTAFDVNSLTKYYFFLKKAAILANLSLEEYKLFFCYENYDFNFNCNKSVFNKQVFNKIKDYLDENSYIFWNKLFNEYSGIKIRKPISLFNYDEPSVKVLETSILYFSEDNYLKLQKIAENINIDFIFCNINALYAQLSKTYDFMYFSNIIQYADGIFKEESQRENLIKYNKVLEYLMEYLNVDGNMLAGYIYMGEYSHNDKISIANKKLRNEIFKDDVYKHLYIKSMRFLADEVKNNINDTSQDMCLVYKKRRP